MSMNYASAEIMNNLVLALAKTEETIKNKVTGQTYNSIDEFNADVANPDTPTKAEDLQQDLKITVASLSVFGKTK